MDQKIGIEFTSTGVERVVADTRSLNKSLGTVVVTVNSPDNETRDVPKRYG